MRSGVQAAGPERVQRPDLLDAELAPAALVGERRVHEPVEQHRLAGVEQRLELLGHELRAGRRVQQRLGARVDVERRVGDELANPLGQLDPAGLAQHGRVAARRRGP